MQNEDFFRLQMQLLIKLNKYLVALSINKDTPPIII